MVAGGRSARMSGVHDAPTPIGGIVGKVVQVSSSNSDGYALTSTGAVYAWGDGARGELGEGSTPSLSATAVKVHFPAGVRITSLPDPMPFDGAMAIASTGRVWAWGDNGSRQFCLPRPHDILEPVQVPLGGVTLAAGALEHTIYDSDGHILTCGRGPNGQLGNGTSGRGAGSATPVAVRGLPAGRAVAVTASWGDAGVLMASGAYYDWGFNKAGQVGDGTQTLRATAVRVDLPGPVKQVSQGGSGPLNGQTMALLSNGQVWEWGNGSFGQLGNGQTGDATSPIRLIEPAGTQFANVNSGGATNYAIDHTGELWSWGCNSSGQTGDGAFTGIQSRPINDHVSLTQVSSTSSEVAGLAER